MRTMTYEEFLRHVHKAGLTLNDFSALVKMNRVSISNYGQQGHVPAHLAVIAALMGEMVDKGIGFQEVLSRIDIAPKKSRGAGFGTTNSSKQSTTKSHLSDKNQ